MKHLLRRGRGPWTGGVKQGEYVKPTELACTDSEVLWGKHLWPAISCADKALLELPCGRCSVGCDRSCLRYSEHDAVWQQHLSSLLARAVRAAAEYWSALGRILLLTALRKRQLAALQLNYFWHIKSPSPFYTELGTRPRASHPAAGFTKSQVAVQDLLVCPGPLLGGCCSWHQCQAKQTQVTFPSSGVSAVCLGPDVEPHLGE